LGVGAASGAGCGVVVGSFGLEEGARAEGAGSAVDCLAAAVGRGAGVAFSNAAAAGGGAAAVTDL